MLHESSPPPPSLRVTRTIARLDLSLLFRGPAWIRLNDSIQLLCACFLFVCYGSAPVLSCRAATAAAAVVRLFCFPTAPDLCCGMSTDRQSCVYLSTRCSSVYILLVRKVHKNLFSLAFTDPSDETYLCGFPCCILVFLLKLKLLCCLIAECGSREEKRQRFERMTALWEMSTDWPQYQVNDVSHGAFALHPPKPDSR